MRLQQYGHSQCFNASFDLPNRRGARLATRQHVTHLLWRVHPTEATRLTVDASYKHSLADDARYARGYGLSLTYDYQRMFCRLARERCVNLSEVAQMCIVHRLHLREIPEWRRGMQRRAAKIRAVCETAPAQGCVAAASTQAKPGSKTGVRVHFRMVGHGCR